MFPHRAIQDADKAILLSPQWPKGYFRRGRALLGLSVSISLLIRTVLLGFTRYFCEYFRRGRALLGLSASILLLIRTVLIVTEYIFSKDRLIFELACNDRNGKSRFLCFKQG